MQKTTLLIIFLFMILTSNAQDIPWFVCVPEIRESLKLRAITELHLVNSEQLSYDPDDSQHFIFEAFTSNYLLDSSGYVLKSYDGSTYIESTDLTLLKDKERFNYFVNKQYNMDTSQYSYVRRNCNNIASDGCVSYMNFAIDTSGLQYCYYDYSKNRDDMSSSYNYAYSYTLNEVNYFSSNTWIGKSIWNYSGDDWRVYKNYSHLFNQNDSVIGLKMNYTKLTSSTFDFPREFKDTVEYDDFYKTEFKISFRSNEEAENYVEKVEHIGLNQLLSTFKDEFDTIAIQSVRLGKKDMLVRSSDCLIAERTKGRKTTTYILLNIAKDNNKGKKFPSFPVKENHHSDLKRLESMDRWFKVETINRGDGTIKSRTCTVGLEAKGRTYFEEKYDIKGRLISTNIFFGLNYATLDGMDFLELNIKNELGISFNLGYGNYLMTYDDKGILSDITMTDGKSIFSITESEIVDDHILKRNETTRVYKMEYTPSDHLYQVK